MVLKWIVHFRRMQAGNVDRDMINDCAVYSDGTKKGESIRYDAKQEG